MILLFSYVHACAFLQMFILKKFGLLSFCFTGFFVKLSRQLLCLMSITQH